MARTSKAATPADPNAPPKPPSRAQCAEVVRRYLKEGATIYWAREMSCLYRLWKLYPSLPFWMGYQLPFGTEGQHALNMMSWFEGEEGAADLARAWLLFNWTPAEPTLPAAPDLAALEGQPSTEPPSIDSHPPSQLGYVITPRKPRTVAEWLKHS